MNEKDQFIANGRQRHFDGFKEKVVERVRSKYTEELQQSGFFKRICIRLKISREIQDGLKNYSSPSDETLFLRR